MVKKTPYFWRASPHSQNPTIGSHSEPFQSNPPLHLPPPLPDFFFALTLPLRLRLSIPTYFFAWGFVTTIFVSISNFSLVICMTWQAHYPRCTDPNKITHILWSATLRNFLNSFRQRRKECPTCLWCQLFGRCCTISVSSSFLCKYK